MSTKNLTPPERLRLVESLERQLLEMRQRLLDLRTDCFPHHFMLKATGVYVVCMGCKETHIFKPEYDVVEAYESESLPAIAKAPKCS